MQYGGKNRFHEVERFYKGPGILQGGGGALSFQHGGGLGDFLSKGMRFLSPFLSPFFSIIKDETLRGMSRFASDLAENKNVNLRSLVSDHKNELINNLRTKTLQEVSRGLNSMQQQQQQQGSRFYQPINRRYGAGANSLFSSLGSAGISHQFALPHSNRITTTRKRRRRSLSSTISSTTRRRRRKKRTTSVSSRARSISRGGRRRRRRSRSGTRTAISGRKRKSSATKKKKTSKRTLTKTKKHSKKSTISRRSRTRSRSGASRRVLFN